MNEDKRITRRQAGENPKLREEIDTFYTPPFASTPISPSEPSGSKLPTVEPKVLFSGDDSSSPDSSIISDSGNQTVKADETLKFQEQLISEDSNDEEKEKSSIKSPADISGLERY